MNDDVRKYIFNTLTIFIVGLIVWIGFLFVNACGFTLTCKQGAPVVERTPIPTLIPATLPAAARYIPPTATAQADMAAMQATPTVETGIQMVHPSNPGGPGPAVDLAGDKDAGKLIFETNCSVCHMPEGKGGHVNPGSTLGVIPALNPIDETLKDSDTKTFAANIDLFIEHGSMPAGPSPVFQMPAWGDLKLLMPQQIADVIAYIISLNP